MSEHDHPFQPGVEVVLVQQNWGGTRITRGRVGKVHKSGRFTLEGGPQQYRASKSTFEQEWSGDAAGQAYHCPTVYLPSPKWEAKEQMERLIDDFRRAIAAVEKETAGGLYRRVASATTLAAAKALLAAINAEKGSNADAA